MGKNHRHQKQLKSEKAKVKLKTKKSKILPKGQNITDTSFKVKKILIKEQLKQHDESEILSRRKLNVKDILARLHHHNSTVRRDTIRELKELLQDYSRGILSAQMSALLQGISSLTLDKEQEIRRDSLKVLALFLGPISNEQLAPFSDILISYLCCAMTHISPSIKADSLDFLDVLVQNCGGVVAKNARKILPKFLDMISKQHSQSANTRELVTLNSRNKIVKWRIKVLERLASILSSVIVDAKSQRTNFNNALQTNHQNEIYVDENTFHIPLYQENNLKISRITIDKNNSSILKREEIQDLEEFNKYVTVLMPLMLESWLEVRPKKNCASEEIPQISEEAAHFLKVITSVMQLIVEYIEIMEPENGSSGDSFTKNFQSTFAKYLLINFPYSQTKSIENPKRRQPDFKQITINDNCLEQNFSLGHIYMWMISTYKSGKVIDSENKKLCSTILEFINDTLNSWRTTDNPALPQLIKLLKVIFIRSSKILYQNKIDLGSTLQATIMASCRQPKRELHTQLFSIITEIILNDNLCELHDELALKEFVMRLPDVLLKTSIHENTIQMLNRVVLQYRNWLQCDLIKKQADILENAKKIEIIGASNEKSSRLMIYNLFHFVEGQIYF